LHRHRPDHLGAGRPAGADPRGGDCPGADARHQFLHTFADPDGAERHTQQYFEIYGYRAMYKDGWWLAQHVDRIPWVATPEVMKKFAPGVWQPDNDPVELYYLPDDFTQARDLAAEHPERSKNSRTCSGPKPRSTRCCRSAPG
jgi:arylsulfatase A-like enzyme